MSCAGECEAEEGSHRRKRRQRGSGTGTPDGTAQRASSKATLPPGTGGTPRRSARAGPLPKPEVEVGKLVPLVQSACHAFPLCLSSYMSKPQLLQTPPAWYAHARWPLPYNSALCAKCMSSRTDTTFSLHQGTSLQTVTGLD